LVRLTIAVDAAADLLAETGSRIRAAERGRAIDVLLTRWVTEPVTAGDSDALAIVERRTVGRRLAERRAEVVVEPGLSGYAVRRVLGAVVVAVTRVTQGAGDVGLVRLAAAVDAQLPTGRIDAVCVVFARVLRLERNGQVVADVSGASGERVDVDQDVARGEDGQVDSLGELAFVDAVPDQPAVGVEHDEIEVVDGIERELHRHVDDTVGSNSIVVDVFAADRPVDVDEPRVPLEERIWSAHAIVRLERVLAA